MTHEPEKLDWIVWLTDNGPVCWLCGYDWGKFNHGDMRDYETHHIERKSHATGTKEDGTPRYDDKCNFFSACQLCHMGQLDVANHPLELALKLKNDPKHFDLEAWHLLRYPDGSAPDRVTYSQIEDVFDVLENQEKT